MRVDKQTRRLAALAGEGDLGGVRRLLRERNALARDWRPIHEAARHGHPEIVEELINRDADVNALGGVERYRPLHRAIKRPASIKKTEGHLQVLRLLLESGADPMARGAWFRAHALATAAIVGDGDFVQELLPHYPKMDIFTACVTARPRRVRNLLEGDPDLANAVDPHNEMRPLHYCAASALGQDNEPVSKRLKQAAEALIDAGTDVDAIGHLAHEFHALTWAGMKKISPVGKAIIAAGADANYGLLFAASLGNAQLMKQLIRKGADINFKNERGDTLLQGNTVFGAHDSVRFLLENGADPNVPNNKTGSTALHLAARGTSTKLVQMLIDHGAKVGIKDKKGDTPLTLAERKGRSKVVALLLEASGPGQ